MAFNTTPVSRIPPLEEFQTLGSTLNPVEVIPVAPVSVNVLNDVLPVSGSVEVAGVVDTLVKNTSAAPVPTAPTSNDPIQAHMYVQETKSNTWKPVLGYGFSKQHLWYQDSGLYETTSDGAVMLSQPSRYDPLSFDTDVACLGSNNIFTDPGDNQRFGGISANWP